jgi:hypothetical protein
VGVNAETPAYESPRTATVIYAPADSATEPAIEPTLAWMLTQLLPSPEIAVGQGTGRFGARWQVTPLLYSWGVNRKLSPWRFLVVEPLVRQSGSIELYLSPEYLVYGSSAADGLLGRAGVRSYFPLVEHGDYLSVSLGASEYWFADRPGTAVEAGAYTLFGTLGVQATYSPSRSPAEWIFTLRVRYF